MPLNPGNHDKYAYQEADAAAAAFNDKVWKSVHMQDAKRLITQGLEELETGYGWGLMPLQAAKQRLHAAIDIIEQMEGWK